MFSKPKLPPAPVVASTPQIDDDAIRRRELEEQMRLQGQGSLGTVRTDLAPSDVSRGKKRVLLGV